MRQPDGVSLRDGWWLTQLDSLVHMPSTTQAEREVTVEGHQ